jgi:hypothetical protein
LKSSLAVVRVGVREVARVADGRMVVDDDYVVRVEAQVLVDGGRHVHVVVVHREGRVQVVRAAAVVAASAVAAAAATLVVATIRAGVAGTRAQRILRLAYVTGTVSN